MVDSPKEADRIVFIDCHQMNNQVQEVIENSRTYRQYKDICLVYDERDRPDFRFRGVYVNSLRLLNQNPFVRSCEYVRVPTDFMGSAIQQSKSYLASFRGSRTHWTRNKILGWRDSCLDIVDTSSSTNQFSSIDNPEVFNDYVFAISRSALSLCPRGHGLASFRFFESLAIGVVPVVVSDLWSIPPNLSLGVDYFELSERMLLDETKCIRVLEQFASRKHVITSLVTSQKFDRLCDQIMSVEIGQGFEVDKVATISARVYRALYEKCSKFIVSRF